MYPHCHLTSSMTSLPPWHDLLMSNCHTQELETKREESTVLNLIFVFRTASRDMESFSRSPASWISKEIDHWVCRRVCLPGFKGTTLINKKEHWKENPRYAASKDTQVRGSRWKKHKDVVATWDSKTTVNTRETLSWTRVRAQTLCSTTQLGAGPSVFRFTFFCLWAWP